ncbi:putative hexosyltransferase MUCI70 [Cardamine amara subsp. amara]|uniref:Hexosyltransferase MUCI70 n=1 Tax=Cardamine amara subsp. amara TaxID=228776 RepID=A0ABD0ZZC7_CARAN
MAQYRQSGTERLGGRGGYNPYVNGGGASSDHVAIGIRNGGGSFGGVTQHGKASRWRRSTRLDRNRRFGVGSVVFVLCVVLVVCVSVYYYISGYPNFGRYDKGIDTSEVLHGRDSRYWDKDDRRRDEDYNEDDVEVASEDNKSVAEERSVSEVKKDGSLRNPLKGSDFRGVGFYNEAGRDELKKYEVEYQASLEKGGQLLKDNDEHRQLVDTDSNGDDSIDSHDTQGDEYVDMGHDGDENEESHKVNQRHNEEDAEESHKTNQRHNEDDAEESHKENASELRHPMTKHQKTQKVSGATSKRSRGKSSLVGMLGKSGKTSQSDTKRRARSHRFSGISCEMKLLNSSQQIQEPLNTQQIARPSLQYIQMEDKPDGEEQWEPKFAGHQSLQEREDSFLGQDKKIHCGFVKAPEGLPSTGFDLTEDDANYISRCHIAVISCIFGNSDRLRHPANKMVSSFSRKDVCFVVFVDEITMQTLSAEGQAPDGAGFIGLWKLVVVRNLPYADMRRVGKIPKLLPHRLFPSARYSIWLDSKLRLQLDPILILEYFLWREGHEYAISNHYDRHCLWEEVAQNKKLNKYNHTVIDQQFEFYKTDGLTRFNASDPNKLLPSNVPEGSFIVREHTPMSNLFSCLWFNEVERFTPRDQLSFAYTYQKLRRMNPDTPFNLHMFKDCERRKITKLFRHRSEEKRNLIQAATQ